MKVSILKRCQTQPIYIGKCLKCFTITLYILVFAQPRVFLAVPCEGGDGRQRDEQVHDSGHPAQALRTVRPGRGQVSQKFWVYFIISVLFFIELGHPN